MNDDTLPPILADLFATLESELRDLALIAAAVRARTEAERRVVPSLVFLPKAA